MNQKLSELGSYNSRKKRNERILKLLITSNMKSLSRIRLFATLWTVPYQAPPTIGFSRQEYWSGLPFPSPGIFQPRDQTGSLTLEADALTSEPPGSFQLLIK